MKVQVIDQQALTSLVSRNIRLYLRMHGWERQSEAAAMPTDLVTVPDVWELKTTEGTYEVIAPSSIEARDYRDRVAELLRTVAISEDRSELDLFRDMKTVSYDVQSVHKHFPLPSGTAPLRDVADTFLAAQAMFSASVAALETPRLVLPARPPSRTSELLKRVLAGPTREGSYVISIWVPVPPRLTQDEDMVLFDDEHDPFERQATKHLNQALLASRAAVSEALNRDDGLDAFLRRKDEGVSANLCEALVGLAGEEGLGFEVQFAWALDRPVTDIKSRVSFSEEAIPVLCEAAREMRAKLPEDEVRFRGNVVRLHREEQLGSGEVTIAGWVVDDSQGKMRRVALDLSEPDYQQAIQAHKSFSDVEVVGSLFQRGTRTYLKDVRGFEVVPFSD